MARVLLVEDDEDVRIIMGEILTAAGHEVVTARDGLEGLEKWQMVHDGAEAFALIITDLRMPRRDGLWLIREVLSGYPQMSIVLLTATPPPSGAFHEDGRRIMLHKPVDHMLLLDTAQRLCPADGSPITG